MERPQPQNFVNRYGVLVMITGNGQIIAKAVGSNKVEYVINLDPEEYNVEGLRALTVNEVVKKHTAG